MPTSFRGTLQALIANQTTVLLCFRDKAKMLNITDSYSSFLHMSPNRRNPHSCVVMCRLQSQQGFQAMTSTSFWSTLGLSTPMWSFTVWSPLWAKLPEGVRLPIPLNRISWKRTHQSTTM